MSSLVDSIKFKMDRFNYQPTRKELKALRQSADASKQVGYQAPKDRSNPEAGCIPVYDQTGHCFIVTRAKARQLQIDSNRAWVAQQAKQGITVDPSTLPDPDSI